MQPVQMTEAPAQILNFTVSTSFGTAILPGDVVIVTSSAGFLNVFTSGAIPVGVCAELVPASLSSAKRVGVYADPDQAFVVQMSTATAASVVGSGLGITTTSTSVGVNRSRMMAGVVAPTAFGNQAASTSTLRVMSVHPIEGIDGSTGIPANTKLLVKFNLHQFGILLTT